MAEIPLHETITEARVCDAVAADEYIGFCRLCGADQGGTDPDARGDTCQSCGAPAVDGAEAILLELT